MQYGFLMGVCALAILVSSPAQASLDKFKKARCNACHSVDAKRVGPPLQEIAARYQGQQGAAATLVAKVRSGGSGNWGAIPMTPNGEDKLSNEDLKAVVDWILAGAK